MTLRDVALSALDILAWRAGAELANPSPVRPDSLDRMHRVIVWGNKRWGRGWAEEDE